MQNTGKVTIFTFLGGLDKDNICSAKIDPLPDRKPA
jgi:hypothetical protein